MNINVKNARMTFIIKRMNYIHTHIRAVNREGASCVGIEQRAPKAPISAPHCCTCSALPDRGVQRGRSEGAAELSGTLWSVV